MKRLTNNSWLNEKSDVYSLGVVLLQIITSRPAISRSQHTSKWVEYMIGNGDITRIVDPKLREDFDINSVWNAVEIATACVSPTSMDRPNMSHVVTELENCLAAEIASKNHSRMTESTDSIEVFYMDATTELSPIAK